MKLFKKFPDVDKGRAMLIPVHRIFIKTIPRKKLLKAQLAHTVRSANSNPWLEASRISGFEKRSTVLANWDKTLVHKYYINRTKMESSLFVPEKLTFSENLRCLNLPLLVGAVSQNRLLSETCFVLAGQIVHSGTQKS